MITHIGVSCYFELAPITAAAEPAAAFSECLKQLKRKKRVDDDQSIVSVTLLPIRIHYTTTVSGGKFIAMGEKGVFLGRMKGHSVCLTK